MLKINFLGDSITEGALASCVEKNYVYLVGKMLNAEVRNYGISGTRIAKQIVPSDILKHDLYYASRVKDMSRSADFVFVMGGTNDFGHGDAPFGKIGNKKPDTFCGAVADLIKTLLKYYDKDKIVFIPPLRRLDEDNMYGDGNPKNAPRNPLSEYRKALIEICNLNGVAVLDMTDEIGFDLLADGLHPNDEGHRLIAELIVDYIKGKY